MSLALTRMQALRAAAQALDKNMVRPDQFGAIDYFVDQAGQDNLIPAEVKASVRSSMGRNVEVPVLDYNGSVQVASSRSCTIADGENTSALYTVNFVTYQVGVSMVPTLYMNNEIKYQKDFARKINNAVRALKNAMDTDALAALSANKTQVFNEPLDYTTTGNVLGASFIQKTELLGDLDPVMHSNGFTGPISVVGNYAVEAAVRKLAQYGPENSVNKHLEYAGKRFFTSINLANGVGEYANLYAIEDGNVDLVYRYDREAVANGKSANGHEWFITRLPGLDIPVGIHYYEEVGDKSTIAGDASADMTCVRTEKYGISVDVAYIVSYNSALATKANPIIKANIAAGTGVGMPVQVTNTVSTHEV